MAQIHHHDPVAEIADNRQVVTDEQQGGLLLALNFHQQIGHRRLNGHVQRRDGFIRDNDTRATGKGARNANALFLSTRQLTRHPLGKGARQLYEVQ